MSLKNLLALVVATAVLALATSAVLDPDFSKVNSVQDDLLEKHPENSAYLSDDDDFDDDDEAEDDIDPRTKLDGITLKDLSPEELHLLLEDEDNMVVSELDIIVLRNKVLERTSTLEEAESETGAEDESNTNNDGEENEVEGEGGLFRRKRWGLVARAAARALFRGASRGRLTSSGSRLTRQYTRRGSFNDAVRDFNRFNPSRQSSFNGRVSGRTGQVGNHRVTVRDGSSSGRPTLEIRSPRPDGSSFVRKFRYQQ